MKPALRYSFSSLTLLAIAVVFGACAGIGVSGAAYVPVYGDYGYVGPWEGRPAEIEGYYYAAPPYGRFDRDHHDEDRHQHEEAREREHRPEHTTPVQRPESHPIPSIPNMPRPAHPHPPEGDKGRAH